MNTRTLRRKRVLVPAVAVVALGVGGAVWAGTASADQVGGGERERVSATDDRDDRVLTATERDRAAAAAERAVGGGTATDVEASDDRGTAYDVEVRATDGTEWDVDLDDAFAVVGEQQDR